MKYFEGKSTREKVLIIGLVVSLVFSLYVITRVNTFNKEITRLDKIYKKDAKKLKDLKKKTGNIKPSVEILREVKKLEEKLEVERQNLAGFDIKFINLRDTQLMQDHIKNITLAAEKNQLRILSKQNELRPLASIMGKELKQLHSQPNAKKKVVRKSKKQKQQQQNTLKTGAAQSKLQRTMFRLKLRGTFNSVYDFINDLEDFEYSVLITKLSMTADNENTYNGLRLVITDITFAI